MFRFPRKNPVTAGVDSAANAADAREGAKGRPTPTRREAEAAARERARLSTDKKKKAGKGVRGQRSESSAKIRAGMKAGDERYLLERDKGPVKKFIRDWVDVRTSFAEFLLPLLVVSMILGYSGQKKLATFSSGVTTATFVLVLVDTSWLIFRLRRELRRRFPEESLRKTTSYALLRVLQVRPLRMPKPRVKRGQKLAERY
ncbi:MAG: DUF3043 domain-containing protein [Actinomycetota bacterium]|nr:DUF3043 domain-containing protein [Actinomycetota bacterium]